MVFQFSDNLIAVVEKIGKATHDNFFSLAREYAIFNWGF
jgi:hypothetical protein